MSKKKAGGFTLIEVLVALAITAMIMSAMMTTLWYAMKARQEVEALSEPFRDGPRIMAMVKRDLRGLLTYNVKDYKVLRGINNAIGGQDADRIDFLSATDSIIPRQYDSRPVHADWCEVGYWVRANPDNPDLLELYRREDIFSDQEPFQGGEFMLLSKRVRSFNITYFAELGHDAEPLDEWDTTQEGLLPRRIRVDLSLEREADTARYSLEEAKEYEGRILNFRMEFVFEPWQVECLLQGNALAPLIPPGPPKPEDEGKGPKGGGVAANMKGGAGPAGPGPLGPGPGRGNRGARGGRPGSGSTVNFKGGGSANLNDLLRRLGGGRGGAGGGGGAGGLGGFFKGGGGGR